MARHRLYVAAALLVALTGMPAMVSAQTVYTVQGVGPVSNFNTYVRVVNDDGDVAGQHYDGTGSKAFATVNGTFTIITLGGTYGIANNINESGIVVGYSYLTGDNRYHAFLYDGTVHDLGSISANGYSYASAINASGQVVGWSDGHAFRYSGGTMQRVIDLLPANSGWSQLYDAIDINDAGFILGRGFHSSLGHRYFLFKPASGATPASIVVVGDSFTNAYYLNSNGQVAGLQGGSESRAFIFTPDAGSGTFTLIPDLGGTSSHPYALNDNGDVVGYSHLAGNNAYHAFLYSGGQTTDLGTTGGATYSYATGISNTGVIVGYSNTAFAYENGTFRAITNLIDACGWSAQDVAAISRSGLIAGRGYDPTVGWRIFVATPVDEPNAVLTASNASAAYARPVTLQARLTAACSSLNDKPISFALEGSDRGSAITAADGRATLATNVGAITVGTYAEGILAAFAGDEDYLTASDTAQLTVFKANPIVTWTPAALVEGTPIGGAQLNATSDTPGSFNYSPSAGAVLNAGLNTLFASFAPTDTTNYNFGNAQALLAVRASNPSITYTSLGNFTGLGGTHTEALALNNAGQAVGYSYLPNNSSYRAFLFSNGSFSDLGTFGGTYSYAADINDDGQITGWAYTAGNSFQHAFLYSNGVMTDINPATSPYSDARAINSNGDVALYARSTNGYQHAFLYSDGSATDLGSLGSYSFPYDINSSRQVVGYAHTNTCYHAFLATTAGMQDLGTLGGQCSQAIAINDAGQVIGWAQNASGHQRAFLYENGVMKDLGTLGGDYAYAQAISETGMITGYAYDSAGRLRAFRYANGVMSDLGVINSHSYGYDVNDNGHVVGYTYSIQGQQTAFLHDGAMQDLNSLVNVGETVGLNEARFINNAGQILARSSVGGTQRWYVVTPGTLAASAITLDAAAGVYNSPVTLKATLVIDNPAGEVVRFTVNGQFVGSAVTDANGVAQLQNVSLGGLNAGTHVTTARFPGNAAYAGSIATSSLELGKATATVTLATMTRTYTGSPLAPTATTSPSGLPIVWTGTPQTDVGSYEVTATINHANYEGSASGTFVIDKAAATVTLTNLVQTYTGSALSPTATTSQGGLAIVWTGAPQTNAGSYTVTATIDDSHYAGSATGTFVINKASATVSLADLVQTYTGGALTPTVSTQPSGLALQWTGAPQANAGTYTVTASITDQNYQGSATGSFVIKKALATVTLGDLSQTYTGGALTPTATTNPAGLGIAWTGAPYTNAGSYAVTATITDPNYEGTASGSFVISKAVATVTLGNLTQIFTGGPLTPTAATSPAGLQVAWTGAPRTNAGTYSVTATIDDPNFEGTANGSFVINKAIATVVLGDMAQTYNGSPLSPSATTSPAGLTLVWSGTPQANAGTYAVSAAVNDPNYQGSATGSFVINKALATVTLGNLTQSYTGSALSPTAATSPSGLDIVWTGAPQTIGGTYPVSATIQNANYQGAASGTFVVAYTWSDVLQPINADGTSIFKRGSTIPVKFMLTGAAAPITTLGARIYVAQVSNGVMGSELEAASTSAADSGNTFRYDASAGQYIFNLNTKGMTQGTWQIRIDLLDGVTHVVPVSLQR